MLKQRNKLFYTGILTLVSAVAIIPQHSFSSSVNAWEKRLTGDFNAHIDFFTAVYLVESRKAVQTPCIIQFVDAVKKHTQDPKHNAALGTERGELLIKQLENMWLNTDGRFLIAKYREEGKNIFLNLLFSAMS